MSFSHLVSLEQLFSRADLFLCGHRLQHISQNIVYGVTSPLQRLIPKMGVPFCVICGDLCVMSFCRTYMSTLPELASIVA
jgi:hypothetical protein